LPETFESLQLQRDRAASGGRSLVSFAVNTHPVREAWFEAALDLRIRIQEPNPLDGVPDDADRIVYLPDFGSKRGTVVFVQDFDAPTLERFGTRPLKAAGYFFSILSLESYARYKREHFIETLLDWGYFGPDESCPDWYAAAISATQKGSEQDAAPNSRPRSQFPASPEVQPSDSQRTPSSGGCG